MAILGRTGFDVFPVCLGGNVFGWTADERHSEAVLDAYAEAAKGSGHAPFIDTSNSYLVEHGQSETIIGRWLTQRGNRDRVVLATKVGGGRPGPLRNLRPETIEREAQASLERLQTDRIDLYYAHYDDPDTPQEESLRAFDALVKAGTVGHLGASNYTPERLTSALELQRELGLAEFTVLQPHYNLVERDFERTLLPVADAWDLAVLPYYALASGFLTGKYRPGSEAVDSPRAGRAAAYLNQGGAALLDALDQVAAAHQVSVAGVAIAWLLARPRVVAPIASARTTGQLAEIVPGASLKLTPEQVRQLTVAAA
jgi:aryl-alcohol dehydrogenase-like predicted oxidoreductase